MWTAFTRSEAAPITGRAQRPRVGNPTRTMRIAVCICTCERPELLASLLRIATGFDYGDVAETMIVVVDNAPPGAEAVCAGVGGAMVRYVPEPRRGRAFARETAVGAALQWNADFIAFLDDDDRPEPDWLRRLLAKRRQTDAGIVFGAWRQDPSARAPKWAKATVRAFKEPASFGKIGPYGLPRHVGTCNVLIHAEVFTRLPPPYFDPDFVANEDKDFFLRARAAGVSMALAQESIVLRGHGDRASTLEILKRGFVNGRSRAARFAKHLPDGQRRASTPTEASRSFLKLVARALLIPAYLPFPHRFMRNIYLIFRNAGFVFGFAKILFAGRTFAKATNAGK